MEIKKTKTAAIENNRSSWLLMGLVTALSFMFIAFEWTGHSGKDLTGSLANDPIFEDLLIPVTFMDAKPLPPPPVLSRQEVIQIVDNNSSTPEGTMTTTAIDPDAPVYLPFPQDLPTKAEPVEQVIFDTAEIMPEFVGGTAALMQYLRKNIKYPTVPQENGIQGKVIVQFVVDVDGSVTHPVVVRSVDPYLDKEAIRVVASMPKWKPGMQRNTPVRVKYTIPVAFKLQ